MISAGTLRYEGGAGKRILSLGGWGGKPIWVAALPLSKHPCGPRVA